MGRLHSEAVCRIQQARVFLTRRQHADALSTLGAVPLAGERTIGKELQAQVHYWRSRILAAQGDEPGAKSENASARQVVQELSTALPVSVRDRFAARAGIRSLIEDEAVAKSR
jgi:hypothetical protein